MPQVRVLISGGADLDLNDLNAPVFTALHRAISEAQQYLEEPEIVNSTPVLCDAPEDPAVSVLDLQKKIFVLEAEIEERRRAADQVLALLKPFGTKEEEPAPPQTPFEPVAEEPKLVDGSSYVTCELGCEPHVYSSLYCFNAKAA